MFRYSCFQVVKHPSRVIEIQMKKNGFKCEAGQVGIIMISCTLGNTFVNPSSLLNSV